MAETPEGVNLGGIIATTYYESYDMLGSAFCTVCDDEEVPGGDDFQAALNATPVEHLGFIAARFAAGVTGVCFEGEDEANSDVNALEVTSFIRFLTKPESHEKDVVPPMAQAIIRAFAQRVHERWSVADGQ